MAKREARICEICEQPVEDNEELQECNLCGNAFGFCCSIDWGDKKVCSDCDSDAKEWGMDTAARE